jgi:hypothetical protein
MSGGCRLRMAERPAGSGIADLVGGWTVVPVGRVWACCPVVGRGARVAGVG